MRPQAVDSEPLRVVELPQDGCTPTIPQFLGVCHPAEDWAVLSPCLLAGNTHPSPLCAGQQRHWAGVKKRARASPLRPSPDMSEAPRFGAGRFPWSRARSE